MASKQDDNMTVLTPCLCGGTPVATNKENVMTHELMYFYKCEKCGLEGETCWPENSINLIPSWNNTIKIADGRKKVLDLNKKTL